jgi:hypothetical protein
MRLPSYAATRTSDHDFAVHRDDGGALGRARAKLTIAAGVQDSFFEIAQGRHDALRFSLSRFARNASARRRICRARLLVGGT